MNIKWKLWRFGFGVNYMTLGGSISMPSASCVTKGGARLWRWAAKGSAGSGRERSVVLKQMATN
jgi:hypothetical protein